jgi:leucyl/phenylalanyl-tRNA--protein transferase
VQESPFGAPEGWRNSDLIGVSSQFDSELVLSAYRHGVFPMPAHRGLMGWYSPVRRGILPLEGLRVHRSLAKMAKRYEVRVDTAFDQVLSACADPRRTGAWIDRDIRSVYRELHRLGVVHSVEAWTADGQLAGGLYGVSIGGLFAGESMFSRAPDASKVALVHLVDLLEGRAGAAAGRLLDVQWRTPHLASLGAVEVGRGEYGRRLARALRLAPPPQWTNHNILGR